MDKLSKEEKQREKQRIALEAKLNKELATVPKSATASMGLLAVDSKGLFKMSDNRWVKALALSDASTVKEAVGKLPCRLRLTSMYSEGDQRSYLSLIGYSDSITEIRKTFDEACEVLRSAGTVYNALSVDSTMNAIAKNYGVKDSFNLASAVRKKKSFKDMVSKAPDSEEDSAFTLGEIFSSVYFTKICDKGFSSPIPALVNAGLSFITALDIAPMKGKTLMDYKKLLEAHYDRQVPSLNDGQMVNVSLYIMPLAESDEAKEAIESILYRLFPENGITIAPLFGLQREGEESIMTLGLIDSTYMRMLRIDEAVTLI
ncbi:MAG: hypothetical protein IJI65_00900 [Lachnospiraceae bacterium]|nr:hypothetical protein [Lachnospiraceae bacterium]MBQ6408009.1 hypothetical protein [Butyrivibrio sp.]